MFVAIVGTGKSKLLLKKQSWGSPHWAFGSPAEWTLTEGVAENKSGQFYIVHHKRYLLYIGISSLGKLIKPT